MRFLAASSFDDPNDDRIYNGIATRLLPFLLVLYIVSFLGGPALSTPKSRTDRLQRIDAAINHQRPNSPVRCLSISANGLRHTTSCPTDMFGYLIKFRGLRKILSQTFSVTEHILSYKTLP